MTEIRALTVRQPWAWAIIHCGKNVENRTRNIAGAYRGPVLIHAGLADDDDALGDLLGKPGPWPPEPWPSMAKQWWRDQWYVDRGAFIGVVDLVDVHRSLQCFHEVVNSDDSFWFDPVCSPWAQAVTETWHLVLANPRPLPKPIPYKGRLGLWRIDTDQIPGLEWLL